MPYPATLTYKELERCHPDWQRHSQLLALLDLLVEGGDAIARERELLLPRRPDEDLEQYKARLSKFTYSPIIGSELRAQCDRFATSSIQINEESEVLRLSQFRESLSEANFINDLFCRLNQHGRLFLVTDLPFIEQLPVNAAQFDGMGLMPVVRVYCHRYVTDWALSGDRVTYVKIRNLVSLSNPLASAQQYLLTYTFIDGMEIAVYGAVADIEDGEIVKLDGEKVTCDTTIPLVRLVRHGRDRTPVTLLEAGDALWTVKAAHLKQLAHILVENSQIDSASVYYVQRTYQPFIQPDEEVGVTFEDTNEILERVKTGNPHMMVGEFTFSEPTGQALESQGKLLDRLEREIKSIISAATDSSVNREALQQSGASKTVDEHRRNLSLKKFGKLIRTAYQDVLQQAAELMDLGLKVEVSGLDHFETQTISDLLTQLNPIAAHRDLIPPTTMRSFLTRLANNINPTASASEREKVQRELDLILANGAPEDAGENRP